MKKTLVSAFGFIVFLMVTAVAFATPVPDTGQSECYNSFGSVIICPSPGQAFYGQDASYSINPMSYTKLDGSGTALPDSAASWTMVKDNITGLTWEMKTNKDGVQNYYDPHDADNRYTWYFPNDPVPGTPGNGTDTQDFITALNNAQYGGHSDWRLPTITELSFMIRYDIPLSGTATTDLQFFPSTQESWYWSSTPHAGNTANAWYVNFEPGDGRNSGKSNFCYVRAVRGGQAGIVTSHYQDNGNGTVTDTSTGMTWMKYQPDSPMTWEQALSYCENLSLGDYSDWRLPSIKELRSLKDYSRHDPSIDTDYFPNTVSSYWWTSTTYVTDTRYSRFESFFPGQWDDGGLHKESQQYVRAVRGGQSGSLDDSVISVSPGSRAVAKDAGATTFSVSNTGTGTMQWAAAVTSGGSWLSITSGASGTNSGTINCSFTANASTSARTATIRVTATGATGSPVDVTVTQPTVCTVTLDGNLMLHIPILASINDWWWAPAYSADFVYEYNPTYPALIIFKMTNVAMRTTYIPECEKEESTYTDDYFKIHIPGLLLADGITRLSVDMEYSPAFSTNGNTCFVVTKF